MGIKISAQHGDHADVQPHQGHVMGDVSANAAQAYAHPAGVGIGRHQLRVGDAADVHVHAAHHNDIGGRRNDVAFACDVALLHQI